LHKKKDVDAGYKAPKQSIGTLPLDDIYIVDSNLVIGYVQDDITGWKTWVDHYLSSSGRKFLMLPQTVEEVSIKCTDFPPGFVALCLEDEMLKKSQRKLDTVFSEIAKEFKIGRKMQLKLKTDIELIVEAGYYAGCAVSEQICAEDYLQDRVVFASANFRAIQRLLGTKEKRDLVEKLIDNNGFEHLITVRMIGENLLWKDFW